MNRQSVVNAVNAAGDLGTKGHAITYDKNGNRLTDTWYGNKVTPGETQTQITGYDAQGAATYANVTLNYVVSQGYTTEAYRYDDLNRLTGVVRDGVQTDNRLYDGASRVIQTGPNGTQPQGYINALNGTNWTGEALAGTGSETRVNRYNANGQILSQKVYKAGNLGGNVDKTTINYESAGGYDATGNLMGYTVTDHASGRVSTYTNVYEWGETARQKTTTGTSNQTSPGTTIWGYNAAGQLTSVTDATSAANNRTFVNDMGGTALYVAQGTHVQRQLVVDGEVLGRYGEIRDVVNPTGPGGILNFQLAAEFNFGYQPVDGNYPSASPGTYAVAQGDTLQGIARGAYGDESLWYLIAEANGLSGNADLKAGQVLTVPARIGSANKAGTFKPYDPSVVIGDTTPNMPVPKPGGWGMLGTILMVVIAVVVAYYTGQYIGVQGLTGAQAAAGYAASAAAGSVASQAVGVAIGAQDQISWKSVALSALSAGVTQGIAGNLDLSSSVGDIGNRIVQHALANAATQGIAVVTGLQSSFNWKSVAASAVSAGASATLNAEMGYTPGVSEFDLGKSLVSGVTGGFVGQAVRGGKVSAATIAADAFGNALGDSLAAANGQQAQGVGPWSDANYRNGMDIESDRVSDFNAFASAFTQQNERFDGVDVAGPGGSDIIRKAGASQALKDLTVQAYDGFTDVRAALSMGSQDPLRIAELKASGLQKLDSVRGSLQSNAELAQEVMGRGLTADSDLQTLGMLGAFGDSSTVHRIAVAVSQAGGAGRATAQGIASQLSAYDGFDAGYMSRIPGDVSIERAAPAVYLNTLLDARSHVDTSMVYLSSMNDGQFAQLGSYVDTVIGSGGLSSYKQNEALAGAWMGLQGSPAAMGRIGEGVSIVGLGLRNVASGLGESLGRTAMGEGMFANSTLGRALFAATKPMYAVPPSQVQINRAAGEAYATDVIVNNLPKTQVDIQREITVRSNGPSGLRTRLDAIGTDPLTNEAKLSEMKASQTAPLTYNQSVTHPEIAIYGGTVVGKGKAPYVGGTQIPPTSVDVYRKK